MYAGEKSSYNNLENESLLYQLPVQLGQNGGHNFATTPLSSIAIVSGTEQQSVAVGQMGYCHALCHVPLSVELGNSESI